MLYGGEVDKGMIPQLRAAVDALAGGVFRAIIIINGTTPHSAAAGAADRCRRRYRDPFYRDGLRSSIHIRIRFRRLLRV